MADHVTDHETPPEGYEHKLGWKLEGKLFGAGRIEMRSDEAREIIQTFLDKEIADAEARGRAAARAELGQSTLSRDYARCGCSIGP